MHHISRVNVERLKAVKTALDADPVLGSKLTDEQRRQLANLFANKTVELESNKQINLHILQKLNDPPVYMALLVGTMNFKKKGLAGGDILMHAPCIVRLHCASRVTVWPFS